MNIIQVRENNELNAIPYPLSYMSFNDLNTYATDNGCDVIFLKTNDLDPTLPMIDLSSSSSWIPYLCNISLGYASIDFNRLSKTDIFHYLKRVASVVKPQNYISVDVYKDLTFKNVKPGDLFVVKPELGAAGVCQTLIDPIKENIFTAYKAVIKIKESTLVVTERTDLNEKDQDSIARSSEDVATQTNNNHHSLHRYINNVAMEFRITTDAQGKPFIITKRTRKETKIPGFLQATGINGINTITDTTEKDFCEKLIEHIGLKSKRIKETAIEAYKFISAAAIPLTGYDLFITEDGEFGFFELCSEWGYENFPQYPMAEEARKYMLNIAKRVLGQS